MRKTQGLRKFGVVLTVLTALAFAGLVFTSSAFAGATWGDPVNGVTDIEITNDSGMPVGTIIVEITSSGVDVTQKDNEGNPTYAETIDEGDFASFDYLNGTLQIEIRKGGVNGEVIKTIEIVVGDPLELKELKSLTPEVQNPDDKPGSPT